MAAGAPGVGEAFEQLHQCRWMVQNQPLKIVEQCLSECVEPLGADPETRGSRDA